LKLEDLQQHHDPELHKRMKQLAMFEKFKMYLEKRSIKTRGKTRQSGGKGGRKKLVQNTTVRSSLTRIEDPVAHVLYPTLRNSKKPQRKFWQ